VGGHLQDLEGRTDLSRGNSGDGSEDALRSLGGLAQTDAADEARPQDRKAVSGLLSGEVEIAGQTFLVQDGELMVYIPGAEGGSELITWDTCMKILFLLKLSIISARGNCGREHL
jgi:hypothetical protein